MPWFVDIYLLYYRKDLLCKADVNEASAFESLDALAETVEKLAQTGITIPFAIPTQIPTCASVHNLAGWD